MTLIKQGVALSTAALKAGMSEPTALWRVGGVAQEHRTDNLSAATHELKNSRGRGYTARYRELLEHYGLYARRASLPGAPTRMAMWSRATRG